MQVPVSSIKVSNVKCHFKTLFPVQIPSKIRERETIKQYSNFFIWRKRKFVYTVFAQAGIVNITGCKNFNSETLQAVRLFQKEFCLPENSSLSDLNFKIDCSTASGKLVGITKISLHHIQTSNPKINISLRPHYFSSAVIREKTKPTILLFQSGSFIILGAKSFGGVKERFEFLVKLVCEQNV